MAAIVYRYTRWITRPPTWRYFRAGWVNFLSWQNFRRYTLLIPRAWWTDIFAQTFIIHRGFRRWFAHMAIFWGVVLSCATASAHVRLAPLHLHRPASITSGSSASRTSPFPVESVFGWVLYHALDFTSVLLIAGCWWQLAARHGRRLLVTQRFGFDLLPLVLLFAIASDWLMLTASSLWWEGRYYWFISLVHRRRGGLAVLAAVRQVLPHRAAAVPPSA
ncbi:MAG: hypothetical protein U0893_12010 [Chloroflexota bacterium]